MNARRMRTSLDIFPEPEKRPIFTRKSDTFLRKKLAPSSTISDHGGTHANRSHENGPTAGTSSDVLRERLSHMFEDSIKPKERRSIDAINTLDHKFRSNDGNFSSRRQVPERQSSLASMRQADLQEFPSWRLPPPNASGKLILDRGRAESPVKRSVAKDSVTSDALRLSPSRTFVRPSPPVLLLQNGSLLSKRIDLSVDLNAPIFMGGGTVEGKVNLEIDRNYPDRVKKKDLLISKLSVDVVGWELMSDGRK